MPKRPDAVRIFLAPPSWSELERRLVNRGTDSADKIRQRLARARDEMALAVDYDYFIINDDVERAAAELNDIFRVEHFKPAERMHLVKRLKIFLIKDGNAIMMLYPAMNKLTQYIPNRYMMVNVVARPGPPDRHRGPAPRRAPGREARDPGHQRGGRGSLRCQVHRHRHLRTRRDGTEGESPCRRSPRWLWQRQPTPLTSPMII